MANRFVKESKNLNIQPSKLFWEPKLTLIIIGFENGNVDCYRIKTEHDYE